MKTKTIRILFLFFFSALLFTCKKNGGDEPVDPVDPPIDNTDSDIRITSKDYIKDLLFVSKNDYQIETSEPATFSSTDPSITITSEGLVKRVTSGEVVAIDVTWTNSGEKSRIYAVGATDNNHVNPFVKFHAAYSDDPYGQYVQGWETLRRLSEANSTFFIVLRHADADNGVDYNLKHDDAGPANWWMSCDSTIARQLNAQGIARAKELGTVFKDLKLPIARVISSEFCRAVTTAELINAGPTIVKDGRLNHPDYLKSGKSVFNGFRDIIKEQPVDNKITLISTHHPINEFNNSGIATFPKVSVFNWTGAYFVKEKSDKTYTYEGAVSWGMFKYWRDKKLGRL